MTQQRSKTRISILRGAKKLFGLTGYQSTTLDDIAKVAGLSASTMQAHFENKESLLLETQRTIFRQLHTRITERNQSSEHSMRNALDALDSMWNSVRELKKNKLGTACHL